MPTAAPLPHGLLFDLDGTLLDSEWYWREAEAALLAKQDLLSTNELAAATMSIPIPIWVIRVRDAFDLDLRIATVPVAEIPQGFKVLVARYRVSENYVQAVFSGGGIACIAASSAS